MGRGLGFALKALKFVVLFPYRLISFAFMMTDDFACKVQRHLAARMSGDYERYYLSYDERSLGSILLWGVLGYLGWIGRGLAIGIIALILTRILHWAHVVEFEFIRLGHATEVLLAFVTVCMVSGPALYFGYSVCKVLWVQTRATPRTLVRSNAECSIWIGLAILVTVFGIWFAVWTHWWEFEFPPDNRTREEQLRDDAQEEWDNHWQP